MLYQFQDDTWRKSSYSGSGGGNCVAVAPSEDAIGVRDTKNPNLGHIAVPRAAWTAFIEGLPTRS